MTQQIDVMDGLDGGSASVHADVWRQHGPAQRSHYRWAKNDVTEVVMFGTPIVTDDIRALFVIRHNSFEEVQTNAVKSVPPTLLRVEVVVCASVILIDIPMFYEHALGTRSHLRLEEVSNDLRGKFRIEYLCQAVVARGLREIDPIVGCHFDPC